MAWNNSLVLEGNLTEDCEVLDTKNGSAVKCKMEVYRGAELDPMTIRVTMFCREESTAPIEAKKKLKTRTHIRAVGRLDIGDYFDSQGVKHLSLALIADSIKVIESNISYL